MNGFSLNRKNLIFFLDLLSSDIESISRILNICNLHNKIENKKIHFLNIFYIDFSIYVKFI